MSNNKHKLIGYRDLFSQSYKEAVKHWRLFFAFIATYLVTFIVTGGILALLFFVVFGLLFTSSPIIILFGMIGLLILYILMLGAVSISVFAYMGAVVDRNEMHGYWAIYKKSWVMILSIIWMAILTQFAYFGALLFLIIPGIILFVYILFAPVVLYKEKQKGIRSLLRSTELVSGHWWGTLGRLFSVGLVSGLPVWLVMLPLFSSFEPGVTPDWTVLSVTMLLMLVLSFVVMHWVLHAIVILYESLAEIKPAAEFEPENYSPLKWFYRALAVFGLMFFVAIQILAPELEPEGTYNSDQPDVFEEFGAY